MDVRTILFLTTNTLDCDTKTLMMLLGLISSRSIVPVTTGGIGVAVNGREVDSSAINGKLAVAPVTNACSTIVDMSLDVFI